MSEFRARVATHLRVLYPTYSDVHDLVDRVAIAIGIDELPDTAPPRAELWNERSAVAITYGDTFRRDGEPPLATLRSVVSEHLADAVDTVHVLPFFPWSSDDGFSVIDHHAVDHTLGSWDDVGALGDEVDLMADLVVNHLSASSPWFQQFVRDESPGRDAFVTASPDDDLAEVVRPRTHPLLRPVPTAGGLRHVWCTFSHDQIDLDFANPAVLLATLSVVDRLLTAGVRWLRLDAVAYVWKTIGTSCIHLRETHELVKLLHTLLAVRAPETALITETNVPHEQNVSYLGAGDEAHVVYNFSFAPLVVQAVLSGDASRLTRWAAAVDPTPPGTTFLNFIASHDGLGLRPAEGVLSSDDIAGLVTAAEAAGGAVSSYSSPDGPRPYELNVSLYDLLGRDDDEGERFLAAHTVMLALAGIPALYIHSFLGTSNDVEGVRLRAIARAINRRKLSLDELETQLDAEGGRRRRLLGELCRRLSIRRAQSAFHPDAAQRVFEVDARLFVIERESAGDGASGGQRILAISNLSGDPVVIDSTLAAGSDLLGRGLGPGRELAPRQSVWLSASTAS